MTLNGAFISTVLRKYGHHSQGFIKSYMWASKGYLFKFIQEKVAQRNFAMTLL